MTAASTKDIPGADQTELIGEFVGRNHDYYAARFSQIQSGGDRMRSPNTAALMLGPVWSAARGLWSLYWLFAILEIFALVQIGRGLWGNPGTSKMEEADRLLAKSAQMREKAESALEQGDATAEASLQIAINLESAAGAAMQEAQSAIGSQWVYLLIGLVILAGARLVQGLYANWLYERQYSGWRVDRSMPSGFSTARLGFGLVLLLAMMPLTLYRFTASKPAAWLLSVPADPGMRTQTVNWLDNWFDRTAVAGAGFFDGINAGIDGLLTFVELFMVDAPWPVVIVFLLVIAWRTAGMRVAIFTAASLAYIGVLGLWEASMTSIVLVGAASLVCIVFGIPLGIWFSRSEFTYAAARPVLDLMQTIPPFVYLIPIIAFFGTGRVPGVLATIVFAMPPVIRLTALGLRQVPMDVKEAAQAFGASPWQILKEIELPLATPTIMTGVNQTILFSLSMVVIASLIGAKGLGQEVLVALQFVAKGQGILSGLAILFCAMMLDRIVQGRFKRPEARP